MMDAAPVWMRHLSVFGAGVIGLWEGIPAGFALRLHPVVTAILSAAGSLTATMGVFVLGDRIRAWLLRRRAPKDTKEKVPRERLIDRAWRRYGVIGLGLLAPGLTGAPIGVAIGLSLGVPARRLLFWLFWGIVLWSIALTTLGALGMAGVIRVMARTSHPAH